MASWHGHPRCRFPLAARMTESPSEVAKKKIEKKRAMAIKMGGRYSTIWAHESGGGLFRVDCGGEGSR